jgi:hypothetical protein
MIILSANEIPIMSTSGSSTDHQQQKPAAGQDLVLASNANKPARSWLCANFSKTSRST